jgi:quinol monooxygenase YgiN
MATFLAHIQVKSGCEADFEAIISELYELTHAAEPGVLRYEYWRGAEPGLYYTHGSFVDFLAFLDHQISDHHEALGPKLMELVQAIRVEWVDPLATASTLAATDMQPLPEGASDLAIRYHERYAAKVQPWWLPVR